MRPPMLPGFLAEVVAVKCGHLGFRGPCSSCCANAPAPWGRRGVEMKKKLKLKARETQRNGRSESRHSLDTLK